MNYLQWMQDNKKTVLEASEHFGVSVEKVWEQINESRKSKNRKM